MVDCRSSVYILAFLPKALVKKYTSGRSSGSNIHSAFPLAQWLVREWTPEQFRHGYYSYGDSAGIGFTGLPF
jgi:hypothetical protein